METIFEGQKFIFETDRRVFSPQQFDLGSRRLLENLKDEAKFVMDLGCGYGALGIIYAKTHPDSEVMLVDVDPIAIELAKKNIELNGIKNARAFKADVKYATMQQTFDLVLANPPWTKNKSVTPQLIKFAHQQLNLNGKLWVVINHSFRTEDLMMGMIGNVENIATLPPYKILQSIKTNQVVNDLLGLTKQALEQNKIELKPMLGQYFLTDSQTVFKLVEAAKLSPKDTVLEIGAGLGVITDALAKKAGRVIAIEMDKQYRHVLHQLPKNVDLVFEDFFTVFKKRVSPFKFNKVVANLPFFAAGSVLKNLARFPIDTLVVIVPEKFSRSLPGEKLFTIPRTFFYPTPAANSVAMKLTNWQKSNVLMQSSKSDLK